jgi:hypothetical protein
MLRGVSAANPVDPDLRPYSLAVVPLLDRVGTTSADMHGRLVGRSVQVWRLSDLILLHTVLLPPAPRGDEHLHPAEPRVLAAPSGLAAVAPAPTQVQFGWSDNSGNETHFQLQRRVRNGDGTWTSYALLASPASNGTTYLDAAVNPGTTYRYRVRACNGTTCSVWSNERTVNTP